MLLRDKRGGEKWLSPWWFLMVVGIGICIAIGVGIFYSSDIDVRSLEADILNSNIMGCLSDQGMLNSNLLKKDFDIFYECKLNKKVIYGDFYFRVSLFDDFGNEIVDILEGSTSMEVECELVEEKIEGKSFPRCVENKRKVVYEQDGKIKKGGLEILTASKQVGISLAK